MTARRLAASPRRRVAIASLVALLLASCGGDDGGSRVDAAGTDGPASEVAASDGGQAGDGDDAPSEDAPSEEEDDPDGGAEQDGSDGAAEVDDEPPPVTFNDFGRIGANGRALLSDDVPGLVVEIDFESRQPPSDEAVEHLVGVLEDVLDKPDGIRLDGGNAFTLDDRQWRSDDLRRHAIDHRSTFSSEDELSIYLLYVRGEFFRGANVTESLGEPYNASEAALFPEQWRGPVGEEVADELAVERAALVHQVGHLLGLVDFTGVDVEEREDAQHQGHSANEGSVMFHAVSTTAVTPQYDSVPPDTFDDADLADLAVIRDGG